jgi:hypothetical protein
MLQLEDDWDGEGSPRYDEATWTRAVAFLIGNASLLLRQQGVVMTAPEILPGPNGSVDLLWRVPGRELLVNVPTDPARPARYYGDDRTGRYPVRGELDLAVPNQWLPMWVLGE